jgi:hypothetical protein
MAKRVVHQSHDVAAVNFTWEDWQLLVSRCGQEGGCYLRGRRSVSAIIRELIDRQRPRLEREGWNDDEHLN